MSNQDDQPQEWTPDNISEICGFVTRQDHLVYSSLKEFCAKICEAHNATLAVERDDFLRQLAAYKQLYEPMGEQLGTAVEALERLRKLSVNPYLITEELQIINAALSKLKRQEKAPPATK